VALLVSTSDSTQSLLAIGGASASFNAVTQISLWTAPDTTTVNGTRRLTIQSDGQMLFNINPPQTSAYYLFNAPTTAGSDAALKVQRTYTDIATTTYGNQLDTTFNPGANNLQEFSPLFNRVTVAGASSKRIIYNSLHEFNVTGAGNIDRLYGISFKATVNAATTVDQCLAIRIQSPIISGGGTISFFAGIYIAQLAVSGITEHYSILSATDSPMYHAGQVRIGNSADLGVGILQVNGDLTFNFARTIRTTTGNLTLQTDAGNGDVIINPHGTGRLRFGTFVATSVSLAGYIEIKDSAGTTRRLAVVT
jgi:hypothetical protein